MDRRELAEWLEARRVSPNAYDLSEAGNNEAYALRPQGLSWAVFYRERGLESGLQIFSTEAAACEYLRHMIEGDPSTRS